MVPFKPFFMGEQTPPNRRLTSSQKSFRTTDIDEVGDHKHLTFFEMLGNFSIGDYFKNDAIAFAWELVTTLFNLAPERLYVTIHLDDDEAFAIWRDEIGVPEERIYRYGDSDNWWGPAGTEGPTGPCSEIHYDGGAEKGCAPMVPPGRPDRHFPPGVGKWGLPGYSRLPPQLRLRAVRGIVEPGFYAVLPGPGTQPHPPAGPPAWIPEWVWSGPRRYCRANPMFMRPTCSGPLLTRLAGSAARLTELTGKPTTPCG